MCSCIERGEVAVNPRQIGTRRNQFNSFLCEFRDGIKEMVLHRENIQSLGMETIIIIGMILNESGKGNNNTVFDENY